MNIRIIAYAFLMVSLTLSSCKDEERPAEKPINTPSIPAQLTKPFQGTKLNLGQPLLVEIKVNKPEEIKTMTVFVADTVYKDNLPVENQTITVQTSGNNKVGRVNIRLEYTNNDGELMADNREVIYFSDMTPGYKSASIVETYNHDVSSYTQGLEFWQGKLFEGTGQYSQSILAEVDLVTGKKIREYKLPDANFGEGISILNDTIYQLTYRAEKCYIYDMNFNLIGSHMYDGEGWGLTNDGKHLIMTNGSDHIYWRNPKTFAVEKKISVYDDKRNVGNLNELELIDGFLYINLYTENRIAQVDTASGKVVNYIDCSVLADAAVQPGVDVMNGIAHNPLNGKIYMTGKWWPKLFEVSFN
ncbi:glutaminyl-peptide cyclotransferase [Crocinitomix algicola]|uniref:glutaminyl-peptide cyclotransferase n=1 Tax=Crocinitomix algicola TaxID=1740263 RepID=UPI0008309A7B|nr:glutaminyl-peptide cyclotransferase [Crocinitomix algicola]